MLGHWLGRGCLLAEVLGPINGKKARGRKRSKMVDDVKGGGSYLEMKMLTQDRVAWRTECRNML